MIDFGTANPPDNPTDSERHELILNNLRDLNRTDDYYNIIKYLGPMKEITKIAPPGKFKGKKIGIIGAGAAGLSAAFELRKLGFDITILESSNRIGGRIYTYYFDKDKKLYGELGPMRIPVSHGTSWHYLNILNLNTTYFPQDDPNAFIYINNVRVRSDPEGENVRREIYPLFNLSNWEKRLPWTSLLQYTPESTLLSMPSDIRKEILQIRKHYHPMVSYWDHFNARQAFQHFGISNCALNMLSGLSPILAAFWYYGYIEMLFEFLSLSFVDLYRIEGGFSNITKAFFESLTSSNPKEYENIPSSSLGKVDFRLNTRVSGIYQSSNRNKVILKYKVKKNKEYEEESFDYVICTMPFSILRTTDVFPPFSNRKQQAIRELEYVDSQKTALLCNRRFWQEGGPAQRIVGGDSNTDLAIADIWYPPYTPNSNEPGVLIASYNLTTDAVRVGGLPIDIRIEVIKRQVEQVHGLTPGYLDSIVEGYASMDWISEPNYLGAFGYFRPEQKRLLSYYTIAPEYNNRLLFAGDHTSISHGWLNGSFQTAMKAANDIAIHCNMCC
ncbi:L-amino-acid oxidase [Gottschalkia purinilytica]|uniref:L-amino-acid oxidase n=1 Tax=Gottschalkia purinilytica TaxID=1503 RepID=A0A0L0WEA7_GOTPU|nr:NAD(P)/FAD-dependent oxidoreductase [Gottschalkia purinilytica]KNF09771.1 L-amino-acid oxidase [Gottschalkia purinilytica]